MMNDYFSFNKMFLIILCILTIISIVFIWLLHYSIDKIIIGYISSLGLLFLTYLVRMIEEYGYGF